MGGHSRSVRLIALVPLLVVAVSCSSRAVTSRPVTSSEETVIDGVRVKVTRGFSEKRGTNWTRMEMVEPIPVTRGGVIPVGSLMRESEFPTPLPGERLHAFVLRRNTMFGDIGCRGFFEFDTYFDTMWNLRVCPLNGNHVIEGVPCMGTSVSSWREARDRSGTDPAATFHANGRLGKCIASRSFDRAGVSYQKWDVVRLSEDGSPQR